MNRPVFHPIEGRADCLACHGTEAAGAPGLPPTHEGMGSTACLTCHPAAAQGQVGVYGFGVLAALLFALASLRLAGLALPGRRPVERPT